MAYISGYWKWMMTDRNRTQQIAQSVREAISHIPPFDGMTLDVDETGIYSTESGSNLWWRVPIIPSPWPHRLHALYEALAEVEGILQDEQGLNILLFPGEASEKVPAKASINSKM